MPFRWPLYHSAFNHPKITFTQYWQLQIGTTSWSARSCTGRTSSWTGWRPEVDSTSSTTKTFDKALKFLSDKLQTFSASTLTRIVFDASSNIRVRICDAVKRRFYVTLWRRQASQNRYWKIFRPSDELSRLVLFILLIILVICFLPIRSFNLSFSKSF